MPQFLGGAAPAAYDVAGLLLAIVVVLALARLFGSLARLVGQPPVIGEILAGILMGPTLLQRFTGDSLFSVDVQLSMKALADVGLVLFMFVVGLELDQKLVRGKGRVAAAVGLGSTLLPFALGALLALAILDDQQGIQPLAFVLFFGAAMSATAFPVLARILTDRGMHRTTIGGLALASAAVIDVLAWTVLAVVVAIAGTGGGDQWQVALAIPFAILMIVVVRPLLRRLIPAYQRAGRLTPGLFAIVLIGLIASAWATEWMHIHFIFGAFLFGAIMPHEGAERLRHEILERLEHLAVLLLLPMFFVVAGLKVDLTGLFTGQDLGLLAVILAVAIGGKLIGAYVGARSQKVQPRQSAVLAFLMNTRGLTEIVILTVGLNAKVLTPELYSLMVLMALITTAMTGPVVRWLYPDRRVERDIAEAERAALGTHLAFRAVVVVPDPAAGGPAARLAAGAVAGRGPAEMVFGHLRPYSRGRLEVGTGLSSELAEMTTTMSELESLADRTGSPDVPVRVVSRFAGDVEAEFPELVSSAEPDVVILPEHAPGAEAIRATTTARLVSVADGLDDLGEGPIAVHFNGGSDASAAVEVALRLAVSAGRPLLLFGGRRATALAERITKAGLPAQGVAAAPDDALVLGAYGRADAAVQVRAERDADPVDWEAVVATLLADPVRPKEGPSATAGVPEAEATTP
ncbi:cation:proton antiporter [Rhizohabitans arisaemae]|uniref:cation:proton antiporter domain-containing protein n=1 Tax=Rhizohabitans arisaemae TaxID=2720610 RepID=UPI0024B22E38|nr:cation:proton antiporter [Rhizohabitans arisaemae]